MPRLRIATRGWAHVLPLALGDVAQAEPLLRLERRDATPDLWTEPDLDGAETSFSRYVRTRAAGDTSVTALPYFIMRGFRHRCIIVADESPHTRATDLQGAAIGLTGWPDSGNTWTRAILRAQGVGLNQVRWQVGRLTSEHPETDRLGGVTIPDHLDVSSTSEPLLDALLAGRLDAVMTPFMPQAFLEPSSPFRTLFPDNQAEEASYYRRRGYIPGIHLIAVKTALLEEDPDLAGQLLEAFARSQRMSHQERGKLQDVTPWTNEALRASVGVFGHDFNPIGLAPNLPMISDFQDELVHQHLLGTPVPVQELFPYSTESEESLRAQFPNYR